MSKFEKLLGLTAAALVFPLVLLGAALALVPLAIAAAFLVTGLLAEAVAVRRLNALAAARQSDRAG